MNITAKFQKQPDLGLHGLSRHFWQATGVKVSEHLPYLPINEQTQRQKDWQPQADLSCTSHTV